MNVSKNLYALIVLLGVGLGIGIFLVPSILLFVIIFGCLFLFFKSIDKEDAGILKRVLLIAIVLRFGFGFIALCYIHLMYLDLAQLPAGQEFIGHSLKLFRDFHREVVNGMHVGDYFSGMYGDYALQDIKNLVAHEGRATFLHLGTKILGVLNTFFGPSFINVLIFPPLGLVPVILTYFIAKDISNRRVASWSALLVSIMPSFIIWSCINIRMTIAISSFLLFVWTLIRFFRQNKLRYLFSFGLAFFLLSISKEKFIEPFVLCSFPLIIYSTKWFQRWRKVLVPAMVVAGSIAFITSPKIQDNLNRVKTNIILTQHSFYVTSSGNNYKIYDEKIYQRPTPDFTKISFSYLIKGIPRGVAYLLFSPFPWETYNALRLFSYPQGILWYFLFIFSILGVFISLRYQPDQTVIIFSFIVFWVVLMGLTFGNVGTAARHRDLIIPFLYIFSCIGIGKLLGGLSFEAEKANAA